MTGAETAIEARGVSERPRMEPARGVLIGGRCEQCGLLSWPSRAVCQRCGSGEIRDLDLPATGTLTTWSRVWVPIDGIEPPYVVGLVEIGELRIFGHVRDLPEDLALPATVQLVVDGGSTPPFWFVAGSAAGGPA